MEENTTYKPGIILVLACQSISGLIFGLTVHRFLQWVLSFKMIWHLNWLSYLAIAIGALVAIRLIWQLIEYAFDVEIRLFDRGEEE